jgi:hypothetical protein
MLLNITLASARPESGSFNFAAQIATPGHPEFCLIPPNQPD